MAIKYGTSADGGTLSWTSGTPIQLRRGRYQISHFFYYNCFTSGRLSKSNGDCPTANDKLILETKSEDKSQFRLLKEFSYNSNFNSNNNNWEENIFEFNAGEDSLIDVKIFYIIT